MRQNFQVHPFNFTSSQGKRPSWDLCAVYGMHGGSVTVIEVTNILHQCDECADLDDQASFLFVIVKYIYVCLCLFPSLISSFVRFSKRI